MNALLRLFVTRALLMAAGSSSLALAASGCSSPFATAAVDPTSPVAADVTAMARTPGPFPKFTDIPPIPADQRPLREFGREADQLEAAVAQLERETAPSTWALDGTQRFVDRAQSLVEPAGAPSESSSAAAEAFARQIRERATPPPLPR